MAMQDAELETDVLVVGSGPMGGATALALATYGARVHVVTRWNWLANSPRAHITNVRASEVMRDLGIEGEAKLYATPWEQMSEMVFAESLTGKELGRAKMFGRGERLGDFLKGSPCGYMDLPQLYLEPIMVNNAAARGASFAFNTEYLNHTQDETGVTVELQDRLTGRIYFVRAKYLVGADGARSKVLEDAGIPLHGEIARAATAYALFDADLSEHIAHRPGIIHFMVTPAASYGELGMGMLRCVRAWNRWIAGWGFDMNGPEPDFSEEAVVEKIRGFVGDPDLEVKIVSTSTWFVNEAHATEFSKGRVFLGGDAVHRHPPSSGLGSNTSIQDGFNLAWKLAYVLDGIAGPELLDSYTAERAPVGSYVVKRANQSRRDTAAMTSAFRDASASDPSAALAKMRDTTAKGAEARKALRKAIESKQDEYNPQGVDMNQRYVSSAVVPDAEAPEEVWERDPELYLQATTRPGAKFPHFWLINERNRETSTLDVLGKGKFSVVTGLSGQSWIKAAEKLDLPYLRTVVIGEDGSADPYAHWPEMSEIDEAGAVLVRPDGYVAWRMPKAVWDEAEAEKALAEALALVLSKPVSEKPGELTFVKRDMTAV